MQTKKKNFVLFLVSFMVGMIYFIPYIRFTFYDQTLEVFQLTNTQMGTLGSVFGLVAIFCYPISGILTQKIEPKNLLTIAFAGSAVVTLWQSTFPNFAMLIAIYVLFAIFSTATLWSPYLVILRNLGSEDEQGRIFGVSEAMRNIFSAIAGYLFIWIFSIFANQVAGYRGILIIAVVLDIIFAIAAFLWLPKIHHSKTEGQEEKPQYTIKDALKLPGVWLMGLFIFSCYSMIMAGTNYLGTYTTQILGVTASVSSSLAIIRSYVISIVSGFVAGYIADKLKSKIIFLIYLLATILIVCILTPILSHQVAIAIVLTMIISFISFMILSTYFSVMGENDIPLEMTGVASGIISCIGFVPDCFVTIIIGSWIDQDLIQGFNRVFIWMAAWAVVAIAVAVIMYLRTKKVIADSSKSEI